MSETSGDNVGIVRHFIYHVFSVRGRGGVLVCEEELDKQLQDAGLQWESDQERGCKEKSKFAEKMHI